MTPRAPLRALVAAALAASHRAAGTSERRDPGATAAPVLDADTLERRRDLGYLDAAATAERPGP